MVCIGQENVSIPSGESECRKHLFLVCWFLSTSRCPYLLQGLGKWCDWILFHGMPRLYVQWIGRAAVEIYHFKCPSPNPVTPYRGPRFTRLRVTRYPGFMPRQPHRSSESLREFLGNRWLPGPLQTVGPRPWNVRPWKTSQIPKNIAVLPRTQRERAIRVRCWCKLNSQQNIHCFRNVQWPKFAFFFPWGTLHISLVATRK